MIKIFDTHCHYNLEPLYSGKSSFFSKEQLEQLNEKSWQGHWHQAQEQGVIASLVAGAGLESSQRAVKIAQAETNLIASVAIHPGEVEKFTDEELAKQMATLAELALHQEVKAIGETGLDYYHLTGDDQTASIRRQQQLFIKHIQLTNQINKPLIIHARDKNGGEQAYSDILDLLKQSFQFKQPFVLHCVSGPTTYINEAINLGAYISFAGNITYNNAHNIQKLISLVPNDKLMIETDAPFLAPQAYRGKICEPWMITATAKFMVDNYQLDSNQILANSYRFFGLK
jgi:TatD DNase family protein